MRSQSHRSLLHLGSAMRVLNGTLLRSLGACRRVVFCLVELWRLERLTTDCKMRAVCRIPSLTWACVFKESARIGSRRMLLW